MSLESFQQLLSYNVDPITSEFSFYKGLPVGLLLFITSCLLSIKCVLPQLMKHRKAVDTRPGMLMINGIDFGISVTGCLLVYFSSNTRQIGFSCEPLSPSNFIHIGYRYAGIAYFHVLLTGLARPVLRVLRKQSKSVDALTLNSLFLSFFVYYVLLWECCEAALFLPFVETFVGSFRAAYFILTTGSHSKTGYQSLKRFIVTLQIMKGFALLLHVFFLMTNTSCGHTRGIQVLQVIYGLANITDGLKVSQSSSGNGNSVNGISKSK